ncbi:hypothetical protein HK102_009342 [Quaeritorhiza haematococci]|nr:hypothetical protein HK102_009342 [Quaeritorhiza haematococci]
MTVVFALRLTNDGSPEHQKKFVRLPPPNENTPYILRFLITAGSKAAHRATLHTNYPVNGDSFKRDTFHVIPFKNDDVADSQCEFPIKLPGVFSYYVEYEKWEADEDGRVINGARRRFRSNVSGSIVVDPRLYVPDRSTIPIPQDPKVPRRQLLLPLDGIVLLTVIPKWLPILPQWPSHFKSIAQTGYNMVHFAPVNSRGVSNSPYSIHDQLALADDLFFEETEEDEDTPSPPSSSTTPGNASLLSPEKRTGSSASIDSVMKKKKKRLSEQEKEEALKKMLDRIRDEFGIISVTDVVWNHTSCDSEWLQEHPEAGYNLKNSPHLRPAYEIDEALMQFSHDLVHVHKKSDRLNTEQELLDVMDLWSTKAMPAVKLWEFYIVNVQTVVAEFRRAWEDPRSTDVSNITPDSGEDQAANKRLVAHVATSISSINIASLSLKERVQLLLSLSIPIGNIPEAGNQTTPKTLGVFRDRGDGSRFAKQLHIPSCVVFIEKLMRDLGGSPVLDAPFREFEKLVNEINLPFYQECDGDTASIYQQVLSRARYLRVSEHGPKLGPISRENPLVDTYFTRLPNNPVTAKLHSHEMKLANNGWIWNADPLVNFAAPGSKAYLRREVIAWGDCVKLRYGEKPEDNPWLWAHQAEYTRKMARLFKGLRIDNAHSTPIPVARYLLDVARQVNPDTYVFAELFTGSEEKDTLFVKELGINSLIREAMSAWDSFELSRLVHRYGGGPVGSLTFRPEHFPLEMLGHEVHMSTTTHPSKIASMGAVDGNDELVVDIKGSVPHALFMDCTHDNETPHQKRTAEDTLPNAAVVMMANCAVGSVKGYDELVPELLNVVTERRKYRVPDRREGIIPPKTVMTCLHEKMAREGYSEIHVHHEHDFISVHRVHPITHDGYLLIARTAFHSGRPGRDVHSPILLRNQAIHLMQSASLSVKLFNKRQRPTHMTHPSHGGSGASSGDEGIGILSPTNSLSALIPKVVVPVPPIITPVYPHDNDDEFGGYTSDGSDGGVVDIPSPSAFYHTMGTFPDNGSSSQQRSHRHEHFGVAAKVVRATVRFRKGAKPVGITGVITGLPAVLDYSTHSSAMYRIWEERLPDNGLKLADGQQAGGEPTGEDIQTCIGVDPDTFEPGSILLFRTWVIGSGVAGDKRRSEPDLAEAKTVAEAKMIAEAKTEVDGDDLEDQIPGEGSFRALWRLLGMIAPATPRLPTSQSSLSVADTLSRGPGSASTLVMSSVLGTTGSIASISESTTNLSTGHGIEMTMMGAEAMVRMGWDVLHSGQMWFTTAGHSPAGTGSGVAGKWPPGLWNAVSELGLEEINILLYRAGSEEADVTKGDSVYSVPGFGGLPYCGLQGFVSALLPLARNNDLGHPMCGNLREGPWMMEYLINRLTKYKTKYPALAKMQNWLRKRFSLVARLSVSFIPKYFAMVVLMAYHGIRYRAISLTQPFVPDGPADGLVKVSAYSHFICEDLCSRRSSSLEAFVQCLVMTSFQLHGRVSSTGLFPKPYPLPLLAGKDNDIQSVANGAERWGEPCLAAGLPHFATNHMRCWGRDVFISLRGLLLLLGMPTKGPGGDNNRVFLDAAKVHLVSFGSTLRHGLIPNLLDRGYHPRYNARDAAWWWLWGVQEYCRIAPEGLEFLGTPVARRFPPLKKYRTEPPAKAAASKGTTTTATPPPKVEGRDEDCYVDPQDPLCYKYTSTIAELCHEILERHASGIDFVEWNAGPQLDHAMRMEGFHVTCGTRFDDNTGFVYGGNRFNCGTWMDKMGDSEKAGIKGLPATPRDGSAVEIVGLCKAAVRWIANDVLGGDKKCKWWRWDGVTVKGDKGEDTVITYKQWNDMLQSSFEKYFYIPKDLKDNDKYQLGTPELVNRRGIYKDTLGSSLPYTDFQLRPNFCVAMVVAPEMFDPDHARYALEVMKNLLLGPMGMKTLDPDDWAYRGVYDNGNDSNDPHVAHGYNYHQGPEWLWLTGYFLRAYLKFNTVNADVEHIRKTVLWIQQRLLQHKQHIMDTTKSPFAGLPELTNVNGDFCYGSCPTQAWSSATMIELVADLDEVTKKLPSLDV